jgi:hypothetical protein
MSRSVLAGLKACTTSVLAIAIGIASMQASSSKFFQAATQPEFLKGDVENLSIDSQGRLMLGPATELVYETSAPFVWSVAAGADGSMFVGTGNEGKVLKVGKDGKLSTFFDASELEVHALAVAPNGGLYVGTSPDGKIYQVAADGTSKTFFDPEDNRIERWRSIRKARIRGHRRDGVIYKIAPDGTGAKFYETKACTRWRWRSTSRQSPRGRGSPTRAAHRCGGQAFVLLDSPFDESTRCTSATRARCKCRADGRPSSAAARLRRGRWPGA